MIIQYVGILAALFIKNILITLNERIQHNYCVSKLKNSSRGLFQYMITI